jgi:ribosomal protein L7/L12
MNLSEMGATIAAFVFLAALAAGLFAVVSSKPFKILFVTILCLVIGTAVVMVAGFLSAKVISYIFSINDAQTTIGIGIVGSICASLVAISIIMAAGFADLEEKLGAISKSLGEATGGNQSDEKVSLSEEDRLEALDQYAMHGEMAAIKHIRKATGCSLQEAKQAFADIKIRTIKDIRDTTGSSLPEAKAAFESSKPIVT